MQTHFPRRFDDPRTPHLRRGWVRFHRCLFVVACILCSFAMAQESPTNHTDETLEIPDVQITLITHARLSTAESGRIREVLVETGDIVDEGTPLIRLDDRLLRLQIDVAKLEADIAKIESENDVDLRFADKSLLVAEADLRRSQQAVRSYPKSISESELDQLKLLRERSKLAGEQAQRALNIKTLTSQLRQKQAEVVEQRVEQMQIVAPVSGMVVEILKHKGEWANVGDTVVRIIQIDKLRAEAFVDGTKYSQAALLHAPLTLYVKIPPSETESVFEGEVSFVSPEVSPIHGEIRIWADIKNSETSALRPGVRGRLIIEPRSGF
jgi:multidrug efflux pump subunit AcrA (membrane-fusion protein)